MRAGIINEGPEIWVPMSVKVICVAVHMDISPGDQNIPGHG